MSPNGTSRTFRDVRFPVAIGGKADVERDPALTTLFDDHIP